MPAQIHRISWSKNIAIAVNAATTDFLNIESAEKGMVFVPSAWNAADLCFLTTSQSNADRLATDQLPSDPAYALMRDEFGVALRITPVVPGTWHYIPAKALGVKYLQIQSTNVGATTPTNQVDARALVIVLKS